LFCWICSLAKTSTFSLKEKMLALVYLTLGGLMNQSTPIISNSNLKATLERKEMLFENNLIWH
jgi:hypothetical protein